VHVFLLEGEINKKICSSLILILVLTIVLCGFFFPALFNHQSLFFRDVYTFHYPLWATTDALFEDGRLPLWNPFIHFGQNISGNPNYLVFYPPAWIRFLIPPLQAMNLFFIFHLLFGGLMFHLLCRRWGAMPSAAFWGGLVYAFSGISISLCSVLNLVPYVALTPAILLALEKLLRDENRRRAMAFLGLAVGLSVTVFEPVMILGTGCVVAIRLFVFLKRHRGENHRFRKLLGLIPALILAVCLSAPILMEGVRLLKLSPRSFDTLIKQELYHQPPLLTHAFWIPNPFNISFSLNSGMEGHVTSEGQIPYFFSLFLGFSSLLLMSTAFLGERRKTAWIFFGTGVFFLLLAWGPHIPGLNVLTSNIPLLKWSRYTQKFVFFTSGAWIFLAVLGLDNLLRRRMPLGRLSWMSIMLLTGPPVIILLLGALVPGSSLRTMLPVSAVAAVTVGVLIVIRLSSGGKPWYGHVIGCLLLMELLAGNHFFVPFAQRKYFQDEIPILNAIAERENRLDDFRVVVEKDESNYRFVSRTDSVVWRYYICRTAGYPYMGFTKGIHYAFNFVIDKMDTARSVVLRKILRSLSFDEKVRLLRKTGVRYVITADRYSHPDLCLIDEYFTGSENRFALYRVKGDLGRIFFTDKYHIMTTGIKDLSKALLEGPLENVYILSGEDHLVNSPAGEVIDGINDVRIIRITANEIRVSVQNRRRGFLVLRDTYYPGWRAEVDGVETPIYLADFFFRAVFLEPGSHDIQFRYAPPFFAVAVGLSILACIIVALMLIWPSRSRQGADSSYKRAVGSNVQAKPKE